MMTVQHFKERKNSQQKISMVTCYDLWSAQIINDSSIDCILVGDSLAMVMHGHKTTLNASIDLMALHTSAVNRGATQKFIVGDMPFLSYRKSLSENMNAVEKIMQAGAHAIKLEGSKGNLDLIRHIVDSGVPVMGHIGLTPQSIHQLGGFKVQGKNADAAQEILNESKSLEQAGCFSIVLECVPALLAEEITQSINIPTIGIGAGSKTDGQVLVLQDMLGMNKNFKPKFLRHYLDGRTLVLDALNNYHADVTTQEFPLEKESYQ